MPTIPFHSPGVTYNGLHATQNPTASQVSAPSAPTASAPPVPIPSNGANRPAPTRASAPSTRPEAAAGLDGWLVDRLFGR